MIDSSHSFYISSKNSAEVKSHLDKIISLALDFKTREKVSHYLETNQFLEKYINNIPEKGCSIEDLITVVDELLQESVNFSSPMFMGFPDSGNSIAGVMGGIVEASCQQNLINSDFCARSATFIEICTVRWLRELIGYKNCLKPESVLNLGGVATTGGTCSNMYGLLMARKNAYPDFFKTGLPKGAKPRILIASDVTHYSISGAVGLLGFGTDSILKVPTKNFCYDLIALEKTIQDCIKNGENIVCLVINAGDSRTLSIDKIDDIITMVKTLIPNCWVHVDGCHGGQLLFSNKYRNRINGIEKADSISLDPHKVFNLPYTLSYFIFKDPDQLDGFWTSSSLIMRDPWALGQLTPNIGSKSWSAIKFYLLVKHLGKDNLSKIIDNRIDLATKFRRFIKQSQKFYLLTHSSDINSVPFIYIGSKSNLSKGSSFINELNSKIYDEMLKSGEYYLHGFPIKDDCNLFGHGMDKSYFVLRYMCGNPFTEDHHIMKVIDALEEVGDNILKSIEIKQD